MEKKRKPTTRELIKHCEENPLDDQAGDKLRKITRHWLFSGVWGHLS